MKKIPPPLLTDMAARRAIAFVGAGASKAAGVPEVQDLIEILNEDLRLSEEKISPLSLPVVANVPEKNEQNYTLTT